MCTRPTCPAETLGGLTVRAPQLTEPGPELGLQEGCGWRATVLWTPASHPDSSACWSQL